jgi:hypothetical protein
MVKSPLVGSPKSSRSTGVPKRAASCGRMRSSSWVDSRPARKSSCAMMRARTGIVVRTPVTLYSSSARAMRVIAAARSGPQTISFEISVS